jgi:hypothetical protein
VSGWWTISIWQLVSRVHCPNLVLFYFILGVLHPKSSIGRKPRVRFFECLLSVCLCLCCRRARARGGERAAAAPLLLNLK